MNTAYDNNLYQMTSLSPDSDAADHVFETRYNAAYSSQPNTPSSAQLVHPVATMANGAHDVNIDEQQAFGQSVASFMAEHDIRKTVKEFVSSCLDHSRHLREKALQNQHGAVRLMHLQAEASALEAEAATWELLLHMYAETSRTYPAGTGGQQTATSTVHHQVAKTIWDHRALQQCARVVTWLEALFRKSQEYRAEQEQGPRFHDRWGVWTDTHHALHTQDQNNGLVSELDPDATTRQTSSLHKDSSRDEDALNAYLFELVKAGRVSEAAETCAACGQPWRAASLLGGGPNGPLPLGPAADAQGQVKALEQLSAEVEANSSTALRSIWKWTCYQVAEAAAQHCSHLSESSGKHEAAVYGALAGHLQRILPVCHTRADILWAYTRCWLESQVDRHLADSSGKVDLVSGLQVGKDAVASIQPQEVHRVVLDDVSDFWPPSSLTEALPETLEAVLEAAQQAADTQSMGDAQQWQLHQDIITENFATLLSRFVDDGSTQAGSGSSMKDKQQAVKLRVGAHLGLALGYLPVPVPTPQEALTIRTQEDIEEADPDPDIQHNSSDDLPLQDTANQLLEQYVVHLIKTKQHELVPLYGCLLRKDMRRKTYASYLHGLTLCDLEQCWQAYASAQRCFAQWSRGDIDNDTELDELVEQVMHEAFWRIKDGPNQWAATLRWLCLSETTLLLATKEANRVLRQLSFGGQAAMQAGLYYAFEALRASPILSNLLDVEDGLADVSAHDPAIVRECQELLVWQRFYQLEGLHSDIATLLADIDPENETQLEELFQMGHRYVGSAVEVCSSSSFDSIWTGQVSPYDTGSPSHEVVLWVAPADNTSGDPAQDGKYSSVPTDQMADFVAAVQAIADTCCAQGITAQVKEAGPSCQAAAVTLTVRHADTDVGTEVQCLNAVIKGGSSLQSGSVPLHVIRMQGPDMCIGALAAMAAYPHLLLHAAQLREILLEDPGYGFRPELGDEIIPLVAGTESDKSTGLTYYFTQQELKQLLELERLTQLQIEKLHQGQFIS